MKAIILAAGKGTRLTPLTLDTPKPLLVIQGTPILDRIFQSLPEEIDEVIVVVKYLKEKIEEHVNKAGYPQKIHIVEQGEKTGTFGSLLYAKDLLDDNEKFLVLNGDDMHEKLELVEYLKYPRSFGIQKMVMPNYYNIDIDESHNIDKFRPQTEDEKNSGAMVATGVYVLDKNIFNHEGVIVTGGEYGLPQTILAQKDEYPIKAVVTEKWIPVNSFEDIKKAEEYFSSK